MNSDDHARPTQPDDACSAEGIYLVRSN